MRDRCSQHCVCPCCISSTRAAHTGRQNAQHSRYCSLYSLHGISHAQPTPSPSGQFSSLSPFDSGIMPLMDSSHLSVDLLWLLLRCSTSNILPDIGDINELASGYLCAFPPLSNRRGHALVLDLRVNHGRSMGEGALHKVALVESCSQEDCINT